MEALVMFQAELQQVAHFQMAGRVLDPDFWPKVDAVAKNVRNFSVKGA